jgi:hypothetical protein
MNRKQGHESTEDAKGNAEALEVDQCSFRPKYDLNIVSLLKEEDSITL